MTDNIWKRNPIDIAIILIRKSLFGPIIVLWKSFVVTAPSPRQSLLTNRAVVLCFLDIGLSQMLNWLSQAVEITYEFSIQVSFSVKFCVHVSVCKAYKCLGCWWKGEQIDEDHWEARMSAAACLQLSQHLCVMRRSMPALGIRGPLLNCVADSRHLSRTQIHTLHNQLKDPF